MVALRKPRDLVANRSLDLDLDNYRGRAELFCEQIDREYYLHHAGHKRSYEIEAIYERHAELFSRRAVEELRDAAGRSDGEQGRRVSDLLDFAFQGHLGQAVKAESARLAELEASLKVEADSGLIPYRGVAVALANDPDAGRRAALETARDELLAERLNPLHLAALERTHELARELGWASYREACAELRGIDLAALGVQADEFARATDDAYAALVDPELERAGVAAARGAAALRPAAILPRPRAGRAVSQRADGRVVLRDPGRPRDRARRAAQRPPRYRVAGDEESARLLRHAEGAAGDLSGHLARRRPRRLRGPASRGRSHRALRSRRPRAGVRVPPPRRQLGHRVVRLPAPAPERGPRLARSPPRDRAIRSRWCVTRAPSSS